MGNTFSPGVIAALAELRTHVQSLQGDRGGSKGARMAELVNALDNAGVFAALDEQTGYAAAEDILAEAAGDALNKELGALDPAEWGDTTRADMARHQGYEAASRLGSLERVPGTDRLVPARERDAEELDAGDRASTPLGGEVPYTPRPWIASELDAADRND